MSTPLEGEQAYMAFMKTTQRVWPWQPKDLKDARDSTLDVRALQQIPDLDDFTSFESMTFSQRQHVLARLRRLEEKVNIKALPAAVALLAAAIALVTASSKEKSPAPASASISISIPAPAPVTPTAITPTPTPSPTPVATAMPAPSPQNHTPDAWAWVPNLLSDPSGLLIPFVAVVLLVGAVVLLGQIKRHRKHEACLNAWIAGFVDSHSLQTKIEEEGRKPKAEPVAKEADPSAMTNQPSAAAEPPAGADQPTATPAPTRWRRFLARMTRQPS